MIPGLTFSGSGPWRNPVKRVAGGGRSRPPALEDRGRAGRGNPPVGLVPRAQPFDARRGAERVQRRGGGLRRREPRQPAAEAPPQPPLASAPLTGPPPKSAPPNGVSPAGLLGREPAGDRACEVHTASVRGVARPSDRSAGQSPAQSPPAS